MYITRAILRRLECLIFSGICLVLFVEHRVYNDLLETSLLLHSYRRRALPQTTVDLTLFSTLFRPDDHAISVPSIPIDCSRVLLIPTELSAGWGIGNQLNKYIYAILIAAYTNRTLVLLEPESDTSAFGCPATIDDPFLTYPSGLQRLVQHPEWISGNCPVPCSLPYDFWMQLANKTKSEPKVPHHCLDQGNNVSVLALGGQPLKEYFIGKIFWDMHFKHHEKAWIAHFKNKKAWIARLGADSSEMQWFVDHEWEEGVRWQDYDGKRPLVEVLDLSVNITSWDRIFALLSRAGVLRFQPWIARDVRLRFSEIPIRGDYAAIHVRRGDKLKRLKGISSSADLVEEFWRKRGHNASSLPTNYIPFSHYLSKLDASSLRDIYVATDDPETVKSEIKALGPNRFRFHFNPDSTSTTGHLQDDSDCARKYDRTISAMADLVMIVRSTTAVGEYSSSWGTLVRFHRTFLADGSAGSAAVRDMRVAFGGESPICEILMCGTH